jgi:ribosomal protein S18 acetylase RimI-like enzyme
MAVAPEYRRRGVGRHLAEKCLEALKARGFSRCHLFVHHDNRAAIDFWKQTGWFERTDLVMMSRDLR